MAQQIPESDRGSDGSASNAAGEQNCPLCDQGKIDVSLPRFDAVCSNCGLVLREDTVIPDWLSLGDSPPSGQSNEDWLDASTVRNATEEQLVTAFDIIEDLANQAEAPLETRKEAAKVYREVFLAGATDGRDTNPIVAACVRLGSIRTNRVIPLGKLVSCADCGKHQLNSCLSVVKQSIDQSVTAPKPTDYGWFLFNELSVSDREQQKIEALLKSIDDHPSLVGKDPAAVAAAAAYVIISD
jgi:transcription initiation factor TFIIIB Brf1 subunit/transcription initiation factor TFIIB